MTDKLLTNDEAAELLTVSRSTLYKLRGSGQIPFVKVGGATRYWESALLRYLKSRERRAA